MTIIAGKQDLKRSREWQFEINKEDYFLQVRWGLDYWIVNKVMGALEGGYAYFKGVVNLDARKKCAGLA